MRIMRLISRLLLLLLGISSLLYIFIGRCGFYFDVNPIRNESWDHQIDPIRTSTPIERTDTIGHFQELLHQKEEAHQNEVQKLQDEIKRLKLKVLEITKGTVGINNLDDGTNYKNRECSEYTRRQIEMAEIKNGISLNNEHEIIPFSHFTFNRIYPVELGLGKRVVEKPIGFKRKELVEIFVRSLDLLNHKKLGSSLSSKREIGNGYTPDDILEGITRTEPTTGTQYELYFKVRNSSHTYTKVILARPFAPIQAISQTTVHTKEMINIIVPLSGESERLNTFRSFIDRFIKVCIRHDRRVHLTVVFFGREGISEVQTIMNKVSRDFRFRNMKLLTTNETFSRGKGLQMGAQQWTKGDVLLFMCDVDVAFSARFLDRCRLNASPNRRVYYPIVFSLYNPTVVYNMLHNNKHLPSETDQLVISRDTGFWRDFGYGMTCQYLSDFQKVKGFDEEVVGWGGEDVMLYRKYVRSEHITVVRATDPGIFHIWHEKKCNPYLSSAQFWACIRTRVVNEASHEQLGLLAYKDDINQHKAIWKLGPSTVNAPPK